MPAHRADDLALRRLRRLAEAQGGVVSGEQVLRLGLSRRWLHWRLRVGSWQQLLPDVYLCHSGPPTGDQLRQGALLWAGEGAALGCATAAAYDGLRDRPDPSIRLWTPPTRRLRSRCTDVGGVPVVVRRTELLDDAHVHPARAPRRTRLARSLVDMAMACDDVDDACALLAAGVQQRLVRVSDLQTAWAWFPTGRHRRLCLAFLSDVEGGSHSLPERDLVVMVRAAGLPVPDRQVVRVVDGRRRYLDAHWDGYRLCAEIDGSIHIAAQSWWDDMLRDAALTTTGTMVIRLPALAVRRRDPRVTELIEQGLRLRGWRPPSATLDIP